MKYKIPDGMIDHARRALGYGSGLVDDIQLVIIANAFCEHLSENPIVPTAEQLYSTIGKLPVAMCDIVWTERDRAMIAEWQRIMFLALEPELKPCPFCACPGDKLSYERNSSGKIHRITCTHCYVAFYPSQQVDQCDFTKEWNRRDVEHVGCKWCRVSPPSPAPEPEVPEDIKDLLTVPSEAEKGVTWTNDGHDRAVFEAYRRGQKVGAR